MRSRSNSSINSEELEAQSIAPYLLTLSQSQRQALKDLRSWCVTHDVYWQKVNGVKTNNDVAFLRYLKARDWQVPAAAKQYSATVAWRSKINLDDLYENADIKNFEAVSRLMPRWTGRRTRAGVPLFVYSVARTRPEDLVITGKNDPGLSSVFLPAEYSTRFVQPVCAMVHPQRAMPVLAHIIDLNGVGVRHFWNLRAHLQKAASMATSHYPESVDRIFIVGAPSFFPTIWGYITKWFDPAITSKIRVLSNADTYEALSEHIDPADLPRTFGGDLDWEYGMSPSFDAEIQSLLSSTGHDWVDGPLILNSVSESDCSSECHTLVAFGMTEDKRPRRVTVANLTPLHEMSSMEP